MGLDLTSRAYPGGAPLRDAGHHDLLERFRARLPAGAPWKTEVPVADLPDQRAWDAKTSLWSLGVGVEAELRPSDLQALELRLALKIRDGRVDRLILVIADTRRNRDLVRDVGGSMRASFPIQGRSAWAAISDPVDPGCNLLLFA